jgi:glycosyltransferase involved in cell wall biosynthesis
MRILLAAKHPHYPQGGGGLERNTHELCLHLVKRGLKPAVICDLSADRSWLVWRNQLSRRIRPSIRFPMDAGLGYPVFRGWGNEDGAKELMSRFRPDVVVAQSAEPVPILQSYEDLGVPRIAYFHEVERVHDAGTLAQSGTIGLLANSRFTAERMAAYAGFMPAIVRPLIDRSLYEVPTHPRNVLFINTVPRKGVEIAFHLAESRPDVQFDFVKPWVLKPADIDRIEKRARAAGNITLHPPTNDMRPHYARARLLLAPSQWEEAWGRVATEAQINGIPVLASNRGGLPESVGPGGLLVPHDAQMPEWVAGFSRLWDDPGAYAQMSEAARAHSRRPQIQPETIVDTFVEAVQSHLSRAAASWITSAGRGETVPRSATRPAR